MTLGRHWIWFEGLHLIWCRGTLPCLILRSKPMFAKWPNRTDTFTCKSNSVNYWKSLTVAALLTNLSKKIHSGIFLANSASSSFEAYKFSCSVAASTYTHCRSQQDNGRWWSQHRDKLAEEKESHLTFEYEEDLPEASTYRWKKKGGGPPTRAFLLGLCLCMIDCP